MTDSPFRILAPSEKTPREERRVEGDGPLDAKIAFVGMAPSHYEIDKLKPFTGPAGRIFQQSLNAAGLSREECYVTNVLKIQPPGNKIDAYFTKGQATTKAQPWIEELKIELERINPNIIVALGEFPLKVLTGKNKIMKQRGGILSSTLLPGKKVLSSIHPASVIHGDFMSRYHIKTDFERAKQEKEYPEIRLPKRNYITTPRPEEAITYMEKLAKAKKPVSFDIEVVNGEVSCIAFAPSPYEAICIPNSHYQPTQEANVWRAINLVLSDPEIPKIGQNLIFDTQFLLDHLNILTEGPIYDTMVGHHIVYPDFPKGLDFLVSYYCDGEPYYKDEGKTWKEKEAGADWEQFFLYNAKDAALTFAVWEAIKDEILSEEFAHVYWETIALYRPLNFAMSRGVKVDHEYLEVIKKRTEEEIKTYQAELDKLVGEHLNVKSTAQCKKYFYGVLGQKPKTRYDKSKGESRETTDNKAMAALAAGTKNRGPIREAELVLKIRALRDMKSRYLDIKFSKDGRFRGMFNPRGTKTGRLSSSKNIDGEGSNLQNIPHAFRGYMVADEGHIMIAADKKQAEWVVTAFMTGDAKMMDVVQTGKDAHAVSGSLICGLPLEYVYLEDSYTGHSRDSYEIEEARKRLDADYPEQSREKMKEKHSDAWWPRRYSIRQLGKHSNHGWNYDMSANRFAEEYETSQHEAETARHRYRNVAYPGLVRGHEAIRHRVNTQRFLETPYGLRRYFYKELTDELYREAYDFIPQSTVAWNVNRGIVRTYEQTDSIMQPFEFLIQCHDEMAGQYPLGDNWKLAQAIRRIVENMHDDLEIEGREFTIETEIEIGPNWRDMVEIKDLSSAEKILEQLPSAIEASQQKAEKAKREDLGKENAAK